MKNLPYDQNLRQKKDLLQNYQKEMIDMKDKKMQEVFQINNLEKKSIS